jgi:hypothetical protein
MTKPRVGPTMRAIADYVSAVPGCSKAQALRGVGLPDRGRGAYRPVERTIAAGLVIEEAGHPCHLFASELDQRLWHPRRELLRGEPSPQRSAEILAEAEQIRAAQAAKYAEEASL